MRSLEAAVAAYCSALDVSTRAAMPANWTWTQNSLGITLQMLVPREGFAKGVERIERLATADGLREDPVAQISLRALAVFEFAASGRNGEARRSLAGMVSLIEGQQGDFRLVWNWSNLRSFVAELTDPTVVARRGNLTKLLDALEPGRDRATLLDALKGLASVLP